MAGSLQAFTHYLSYHTDCKLIKYYLTQPLILIQIKIKGLSLPKQKLMETSRKLIRIDTLKSH